MNDLLKNQNKYYEEKLESSFLFTYNFSIIIPCKYPDASFAIQQIPFSNGDANIEIIIKYNKNKFHLHFVKPSKFYFCNPILKKNAKKNLTSRFHFPISNFQQPVTLFSANYRHSVGHHLHGEPWLVQG